MERQAEKGEEAVHAILPGRTPNRPGAATRTVKDHPNCHNIRAGQFHTEKPRRGCRSERCLS